MAKRYAQIIGTLVFAAGLIGLLSGEGQLMGIINIDLAFDVIRLLVGAVLLYAGFGNADARTTRTIVGVVGGMYVVMGIVGLFSPEMLGLLPNDLTGFDVAFHLLGGALGLALAATRENTNQMAHSA